jgi:WD40 repeat protein
LWQSDKAHCLYALHGSQGVISSLKFLEISESKNWLFAADSKSEIHVWNCEEGNHLFALQGHFSTITELAFYENQYLIRLFRK